MFVLKDTFLFILFIWERQLSFSLSLDFELSEINDDNILQKTCIAVLFTSTNISEHS